MQRRLGKIVAGLFLLLIGLGSGLYLYGAVLASHYVRSLLIEAGVPDDNLQVELGFAGTARLSLGLDDAPYVLVEASAPALLKLRDRQPVEVTINTLQVDWDKLSQLAAAKSADEGQPATAGTASAALPVHLLQRPVDAELWRYVRSIEVTSLQLSAESKGVQLTGALRVQPDAADVTQYQLSAQLSGHLPMLPQLDSQIELQGGRPQPSLIAHGTAQLDPAVVPAGVALPATSYKVSSTIDKAQLQLAGQASLGPKASPVGYEVTLHFDHKAQRITNMHGQYKLMDGVVRTHTKIDMPYGEVIAGKAWPLTRSIGGQATVEAVDLAQVLANFAPEGLSGTGRVSGEVPYRFEPPFKLVLTQGQLRTTGEGGVIQYRPAAKPSFLAEGGQAAFLGQLFDDFRYSSLSVGLNGAVGDTLTLQTKLAGSNSAFYNGRSVAFTLNLSGALLEVLKSGGNGFKLSAGDVAAAVEKGKTAP